MLVSVPVAPVSVMPPKGCFAMDHQANVANNFCVHPQMDLLRTRTIVPVDLQPVRRQLDCIAWRARTRVLQRLCLLATYRRRETTRCSVVPCVR